MFGKTWRPWLSRLFRLPVRVPIVGRNDASRRQRPRLEFLEDRLAPAVYVVDFAGPGNDPFADSVDAAPRGGTGTAADPFHMASLRGAIIATNNAPGADTIILPAGNYLLTLGPADPPPNPLVPESGDLDITDDVSIQGAGGGPARIDASALGDRVFHVAPISTPIPLNVNFVDLTITGGTVNQQVGALGGGIANTNANLLLQRTNLVGNAAIANDMLAFLARAQGGALYNDSGNITIEDSTVANNLARANGTAQIFAEGGGIFQNSGTLTIRNSTFANNQAVTTGAGSDFHSQGGALFHADGNTAVFNSTFSGNAAAGSPNANGGAIFMNAAGSLFLAASTVAFNNAATGGGLYVVNPGPMPAIRNTILANNNAALNGNDVFGAIISQGNNLILSPLGSNGFGPQDLQNVDPQLNPLEPNGGPTLTHALAPTSPAIDAGGDVGPLGITTDQRGFARVFDAPNPNVLGSNGTDIGAFEFGAAFVPLVTLSVDTPSIAESSGAVTVFATLSAPSTLDVTVNLALSGKATIGTDYQAPLVSITIIAGEISGSLVLTALDDTLIEGDESIVIDIAAVVNANENGTQQRTVTILDADSATIEFVQATQVVGEDATPQNIVARFVTDPVNTLQDDATFNVTLKALGTAEANDFDAALFPKQLTFLAGSGNGLTQSVTFAPQSDDLVEGNETLTLGLAKFNAATSVNVTTVGINVLLVTIQDADAATASFQLALSSSLEGPPDVTLQVLLSMAPGNTLENDAVFDVAAVALTAEDTDFTLGVTQVTFTTGSANGNMQLVTLTLATDTLIEGDETFNLNLTVNAGAATVGAIDTHTLTIQDANVATVSFAAAASTASENGVAALRQAVLTTAASDTLENDAVFNVAATLGTAEGTDFTLNTLLVTFLAGAGNGSSQNVSITPLLDTLIEGDETLNLILTVNAGAATVGAIGTHTLTIQDANTATVSFQTAASTAPENGAAALRQVVLTTTPGDRLENPAVFNVTATLGSAEAADFTLNTVQITFAVGAGNGSPQNVSVTPLIDTLIEGDETLNLVLSINAGAATVGAIGTHTLTIQDANAATVSFAAAGSTAPENGVAALRQAVLTTVPGDTLENAAVFNVAATLGNAEAVDFTLNTVQITFAVGAGNGSPQNVSVTPLIDTLIEGDETLNLVLSINAGAATVGAIGTHTLTILDANVATVSFLTAGSTAPENGVAALRQAVLTTTVSDTLENDAVFNVVATLGTAEAADFTLNTVLLTFLAGAGNGSSQNVSVTPLTDVLVEGDETLNLNLSVNAGAATVGAIGTHTLTILDADIDLVLTKTESVDPAIAGSGEGNLTYVVTVSNPNATNATGVVVNELLTLPAGVTVLAVTSSVGLVTANSPTNLTWNLGNLASGVQQTLTVVLTVGAAAAAGQDVITNRATITAANETLNNLGDDTAVLQTSIVQPQANLAVTQTAPATAVPGSRLTYIVRVANLGPNAALNVVLTDVLPTGTRFVSQVQIGGPAFTLSNKGNRITNRVAVLPAGAVATFRIVVAAPIPGRFRNVATVVSATTDAQPNNNNAAAVTIVGSRPERWVQQVYLDLVQRNVDRPALNQALGILNQPGNPAAMRLRVAQELVGGLEYMAGVVRDAFLATLRRHPGTFVCFVFLDFLNRGGTVEGMLAQLYGTPEYFQTQGRGTNAGFAAALFRDILGRPIDAAGRALVNQLFAQGLSRQAIAENLIGTVEAQRRLVRGLYQRLLGRNPTAQEVGGSVAALRGGVRQEQLIAQIVASQEYFNRV